MVSLMLLRFLQRRIQVTQGLQPWLMTCVK